MSPHAVHGQATLTQNLSNADMLGLNSLTKEDVGLDTHARIDLTCEEDYFQRSINWILPRGQLYPASQAWPPFTLSNLPR